MKTLRTLAIGLGLALAACTGSSEEPTRALLAAGVVTLSGGTPGTPSQIRFYQSSTLQPGNADPLRLVGSWDVGAPLVALFYRRSLGSGSDQLWVLTPDRLRRFVASGLSVQGVGTPQLDGLDAALGVDCARGYLRPGQGNLLLVCPPAAATPPAPIEQYRAWVIPFGAAALPTPVDFLSAGLRGLTTPARLALGANDQLLYLTPRAFGQFDSATGQAVERSLTFTGLIPTDLILAGGQGLGLMDDADTTTTDTNLISWNLSATTEVGRATNSDIAARLFAQGAPPVFALGTGLARFESGFQLPREAESGLQRARRWATATVGIDQFLYVAEEGSPTVSVIDLTVNTATALTTGGVRSTLLSNNFQERITGLAFIPVE